MGSTPRGTWIGAPKPSTRCGGAMISVLMQDESIRMRLRAINALGALKITDDGQVITAAEYNALIDAIIGALYI